MGASVRSACPRNKVIVAIANRLARIAWAVLVKGKNYRALAAVAAASTNNNLGSAHPVC
ncbi:MAG TPA: hypothetical protein VGV15_03010 [Terriglobales bacterium]|nr:hypothetical protein [Terriglobales bacterium]